MVLASSPAGRRKLQADIEALFDQKPPSYTAAHFALFAKFKEALNAGAIRAAEPDPASRRGMARQRLGQEGNPPRLSHGRRSGHVD